jgi:DNA-binding NarL/FixJ family response regulator
VRPVRFISIDDHPAISDALDRAAAEQADLQMIGAFNSIESVPMPMREPGEFVDVAILDLNLPGIGGFDGIETVAGWGMAVLVFSANTAQRVASECLKHGASGFVTKSISTPEVLDAVRAVGRGERAVVGTAGPLHEQVRLSRRDERLLEALTEDSRSKALAARLNLSPGSVDNQITDLYLKIGLAGASRSRAGLRDWAREHGYGEPSSG